MQLRGVGQSRRIPSSPITTSSTRAVTSRRGNGRQSLAPNCELLSGHCVNRPEIRGALDACSSTRRKNMSISGRTHREESKQAAAHRPSKLDALRRVAVVPFYNRGDSRMNTNKIPNAIDPDRRHFLGTAALTIAAAQLALTGSANAETGTVKPAALPAIKPESNTSFASLKQIDAGLLNVGYAEAGPADGPPVLLLHGWPYDIHSFVDVAPLLASAGYRVIVPYLRGFGSTQFLSDETFRNAQQSAVALDVIALMDALKIQKAIIGGFDWGARTADVIAVLWPERCKALVSVSGYLITNLEANLQPLPPQTEWGWWYQYYFSTERGRIGYDQNRYAFAKLIWKNSSPKWNFDDASFDRTATALNNPAHVRIVMHDYRWRLSLAAGEPQYDNLETKLSHAPTIAVPTITLASDFDGAGADGTHYRRKFVGTYAHRILKDIGHNVPQEAPQAFVQAIIDVGRV